MIQIQEQVPLAPQTTFGIGGSARYFAQARTEDDIREVLEWAREHKLRFVVLSGGSNVLIPDEGIDGLVLKIISNEHSFADSELAADGGCNLLELIREASKRGLGGWEKLAGIPGTVGGAVRGNAGAFGPEIKDFVTKVVALDVESGTTKIFLNEVCDFSYRHSFFKDNPGWIITRVFVELQKTDPAVSAAGIEATIAEREKRHLQNVRAAGSYFMNPAAPEAVQQMFEREKGVPARLGRVPAGWLIEKAGMKGATVGGAIASSQHPNYLVNKDGATAEDVKKLAEKVKDAVWSKFGVVLNEEAAVL